jgi:CheY-like chemotaxis protein
MACILIAEDHAVDRQFLVTLLGHQGHTMLEASDGSEALEVVRRSRPELVISDILMPTMDGWQLRTRLRSDPALSIERVRSFGDCADARACRTAAERHRGIHALPAM